MNSRLVMVILLFCTACSWEYHRSRFIPPYYNPQPGEYYSISDSIRSSNHESCKRTQYFIHKGDWLHMSSCQCTDAWTVDSAFDQKGNLYLINKHHLQSTSRYLYDTSLTMYFDTDERLLKRFIYINKPDTSYEYWQYYDAQGKPEAEKREVIYELIGNG